MHQPWLVYVLLVIMVLCIIVSVGLLVWWKRWHASQLKLTEQDLCDQHGINIQEYAIFPGLCPCEIANRQEGWRQQFIALKNLAGTTSEGQKSLRWAQLLAEHWGIESYISIDPEESEGNEREAEQCLSPARRQCFGGNDTEVPLSP